MVSLRLFGRQHAIHLPPDRHYVSSFGPSNSVLSLKEDTDLRIGIAGLGTASGLVLPYLGTVEGARLTGAADSRATAREEFQRRYGLPGFASVQALCDSGEIDAIWIETPNHFHCEHTIIAAERGKHVICAKPFATTLDECDRMIAACGAAGVRLLIGHSKIFDSPVQAMAKARSRRSGNFSAGQPMVLWYPHGPGECAGRLTLPKHHLDGDRASDGVKMNRLSAHRERSQIRAGRGFQRPSAYPQTTKACQNNLR
jgi:hypothetical protein